MRRAGDETRRDAGAEDPEHEDRKRAEHGRKRLLDGDVAAGEGSSKGAEQGRTDADDDGEHHQFDAGGNHVAEHAFGKECGLVPQRERHKHEARKRRQLEFEDGDEELDRENEEGQEHDEPGDHQHGDLHEVFEEGDRADEVADFRQERLRRVKARRRDKAGTHQIGGADRSAGGAQAKTSEGIEDDIREKGEIVQDEGEGADIKHLADQRRDDRLVVGQGPEKPGKRDVDPDQDGREEGDVRRQQAEAGIDIADERIRELIDDVEVVHRLCPLVSAAYRRRRRP
ncbi:hypothetical protein AQ1_01799 [alpha proteobacterium Q-1]|nr:hypothetical protein AQ1_01799 [alpha proteobacterium Q-1]